MFNEIQKKRVAERLSDELGDISPDQIEEVGKFVFNVAALDVGRDVDYVLDVLESGNGTDSVVIRAATICLTELAKNN